MENNYFKGNLAKVLTLLFSDARALSWKTMVKKLQDSVLS